jgi:hypothetical protein
MKFQQRAHFEPEADETKALSPEILVETSVPCGGFASTSSWFIIEP